MSQQVWKNFCIFTNGMRLSVSTQLFTFNLQIPLSIFSKLSIVNIAHLQLDKTQVNRWNNDNTCIITPLNYFPTFLKHLDRHERGESMLQDRI